MRISLRSTAHPRFLGKLPSLCEPPYSIFRLWLCFVKLALCGVLRISQWCEKNTQNTAAYDRIGTVQSSLALCENSTKQKLYVCGDGEGGGINQIHLIYGAPDATHVPSLNAWPLGFAIQPHPWETPLPPELWVPFPTH